jgi:membrane associated rhomboid family serine protease
MKWLNLWAIENLWACYILWYFLQAFLVFLFISLDLFRPYAMIIGASGASNGVFVAYYKFSLNGHCCCFL